jgi:hypothetical protein
MKSFRKLSFLTVVLVLSTWILPILTRAIIIEFKCCKKTKSCCKFKKKKQGYEGLLNIKDYSATSGVCPFRKNSNDKPYCVGSRITINKFKSHIKQNNTEGQNIIKTRTNIVLYDNIYIPIHTPLLFLKSSFLL